MEAAPVVLFVYNRLWHTQQTIESLLKNDLASETEIFIYCDAPKKPEALLKVNEVRDYIKSVKGFKKINIIERTENFGLAKSIITGVTDIVSQYGKIIVLEDDMVTSKYFLKFMNDALDLYKDEEKVTCINAYNYPVKKELPETFFIKGADCWGWATWKRAWDLFQPEGKILLDKLINNRLTKKFEFDHSFPYINMLKGQIAGEINSWAIRWYASAFLADKLCLYPGKSLLKNIGNDGSGTNCPPQDQYDVEISEHPVKAGNIQIVESKSGYKAYKNYFKKTVDYYRPWYRKILSKIKKIILNKKS